MSLLYERSNRLWHWLIKHRLVHALWRPFVQCTRLRHLAVRRRMAQAAVEPPAVEEGAVC